MKADRLLVGKSNLSLCLGDEFFIFSLLALKPVILFSQLKKTYYWLKWNQSVSIQVKVAPKKTWWHQLVVSQGSSFGSILNKVSLQLFSRTVNGKIYFAFTEWYPFWIEFCHFNLNFNRCHFDLIMAGATCTPFWTLN